MVTAIGFELNVKLSQQMGATGYLTKPFSPQDLINTIVNVLENREVQVSLGGSVILS
jgi:DNA-binding response OmpR family regulator